MENVQCYSRFHMNMDLESLALHLAAAGALASAAGAVTSGPLEASLAEPALAGFFASPLSPSAAFPVSACPAGLASGDAAVPASLGAALTSPGWLGLAASADLATAGAVASVPAASAPPGAATAAAAAPVGLTSVCLSLPAFFVGLLALPASLPVFALAASRSL